MILFICMLIGLLFSIGTICIAWLLPMSEWMTQVGIVIPSLYIVLFLVIFIVAIIQCCKEEKQEDKEFIEEHSFYESGSNITCFCKDSILNPNQNHLSDEEIKEAEHIHKIHKKILSELKEIVEEDDYFKNNS